MIEADELSSFVGSKWRVFWVRVALDADTRRVLGVVVGDRDAFTAECLWLSLPAEYRDEAVFHTDFLPADRAVLPAERHAAAGKGSGLTNHVERFGCTVRQRCSRLVRKARSFSMCLENHLGALWDFIHRYNASLP